MSIGTLNNSLDFLRDVVKHEMELEDDRIVIYNQGIQIPEDPNLWLAVRFVSSRIISSRTAIESVGDEAAVEVNRINTNEHLAVDIMSKNLEALQRKEEVIMALNSIYSQQQQEKYSFQIARIAPIQDISQVEGDSILYRFEVPVVMFSWYSKTKSQTFYDRYSTQVRIDDGVQPDVVVEFDQT